MDRNETIKAIKTALQKRSGKQWSVTGGRGTAWGWIKIDAPPSRCTWHHVESAERDEFGKFVYTEVNDPSKEYGNMSPAERKELADLFGLETVHHQGVSIASSNAHYREYIERAEGRKPLEVAQPYWD